ncbi:MAG TPA: NAD(P)-dependent oxidoreductase [Haliangiales bacterium]|nr:NAD(P)-dependent oxidoreductase [Haliangiales bacterium]
MKILIADKFSEAHLADLRALGLTVEYKPDLGAGDLPAALPGASILVVRSTEVNAAAIGAADALTLIVRAGAGVNTIDRSTASKRGIFVANCPGKNAVAVAELTMALLLAVDRRVPEQVAELRAGKWNKKEYGKADGILGKTLGLVGFGAIARLVAERARAFGMPIVAWSRSLDEATARHHGVDRLGSAAEVAHRADVVSVHVALTGETRGLCGAGFFAAMRPGTIFLNTSRAEVVDAAALEAAVREKGIRVGTDVPPGEPSGGTGAIAAPLLGLPGVYGTHHVGASTRQAENAIADEAVRIVAAFVQRGQVPNCVNLSENSAAGWQLVVRHYDRVGVLAHVLDSLRRHDINVQEMENQIFDGAIAACAAIRLSAEPPPACMAEIRARDDILHAALIPLPSHM